MQTVTSFHTSAVSPEQLAAIMADYLALEQLRVFRRLLVVRCGLVALAIALAGLGFGWLPRLDWIFGTSLFLAVPAAAWVVEWRRARRLADRLEHVPFTVEDVVQSPTA